MKFKLRFPSGYRVKDIGNDNLDVHVITPDDKVYFGTLFTMVNIKELMAKEDSCYFWATDMIVVKSLSYDVLHEAIQKMIDDGYLNKAFSVIGTVSSIYTEYDNFEQVPFMRFA